ncbi:hypothetical protein DUNSADRAFT_11981 [Dunaliella salina]|uniref:Encoded protein n=1 Tax=Dunaliella salina TaxID=3046 RepID=A0ABQ7GC60_DUNSA|nr:hypothetical protein DUNSADRAFT_11981 [Dunaliella salina]|eukprot:KAF5832197.1 hypothetical protein DUNSADRAFT_11981 [Dunaliella salina]
MFHHALASACLHCLSRALLLLNIIRGASCSSISLISLELYVVVYITRNAGLLVKFEGWEEVVEVVKIGLSVASVLLLRYSPHASRTYDEGVDNLPRWILLLPPFLLSLVFNRVVMIVEICRQFSWYLEPVVLIPQWLVMWRRKNYPFWHARSSNVCRLHAAMHVYHGMLECC